MVPPSPVLEMENSKEVIRSCSWKKIVSPAGMWMRLAERSMMIERICSAGGVGGGRGGCAGDGANGGVGENGGDGGARGGVGSIGGGLAR
eukprot:3154470-Prymnesium_polylepis.2